MKVYQTPDEIRSQRWAKPTQSWGLVPTMGSLHEGHLNLVRTARSQNDKVGVSIFINPAQFNNPEDLEKYPRDLKKDLTLLEKEKVDLVWTPTPEIVYPAGFQTHVEVDEITRPLEGAYRLGHFKGVTTVVAKLFNVFQPTKAYFGQKDAQQLFVIERMVKDLNFNLEIVRCPILREPDGLAMSSRNVRLSSAARQQAVCLNQALLSAKDAVKNGETDSEKIKTVISQMIHLNAAAKIDYISIAELDTLNEVKKVRGSVLISLAVYFDDVRLIDNILLGL